MSPEIQKDQAFIDLKVNIRGIKETELYCLGDFLYDAIFIPHGREKPGKEIIDKPEISRYMKDFGKESDLCLVAEYNGELIGAIWTRIFSESEGGFGYVDSITPELSMSVKSRFRNQGIGTKLLIEMMDKLIHHGYHQVSLSVDLNNFAQRFYLKWGFKNVQTDNKSAIMQKQLI